MALRRSGQTIGRRGRTIDFKQWASIPALGTAITGDGTFQGGSVAFAVPATILRCRGFVQAAFASGVQVGDDMNINFGLGIVSTDAFAAGAGSMPDPAGEPEYPWLWWQEVFLNSEQVEEPVSWGPGALRLDVDTKAMRKVKPGESLVWVGEATQSLGAPEVNVDFGRTRVLIGT